MANYRIVFLLNTLAVLVVAVVSLALNGFGSSVKGLFFPPCLATYPGAGFFFLMFHRISLVLDIESC